MIARALVIGSMNCMPTEYAFLLTHYCEEVIHYYDSAEDDSLSNPLLRWGDRSKRKVERLTIRKMRVHHYLSFLLPRVFHRDLLAQINSADLVILSGPAISLARLIKSGKRRIIALSYGSDISAYCSREWARTPAPRSTDIRKLITSRLGFLRERFVELQIAGLRKCTHYSYFIPGFDLKTDALIECILADHKEIVRLPRYSIGLELLTYNTDDSKLAHHRGKYKILFPVRFCDDELFGNKGWRMLFDGLKTFSRESQIAFVCICFKKGDFSSAQAYAQEIGIQDSLEWHEVVPFDALVSYYRDADVVIEQLGSHWIAQGLFAMALGKPVIGRLSTSAQVEFFRDSGLLSVDNIDSLVKHLVQCESESFRNDIGSKSRAFVPAKASIEPEFLGWGVL